MEAKGRAQGGDTAHRFYISSPFLGLKKEREVAKKLIIRRNHAYCDSYGGSPDPLVETCQRDVRASDHYILILGESYGTRRQDHGGKSLTELEFEAAVEAGLSLHAFYLGFVSDVRNGIERDAEAQAALMAFRRRVSNQCVPVDCSDQEDGRSGWQVFSEQITALAANPPLRSVTSRKFSLAELQGWVEQKKDNLRKAFLVATKEGASEVHYPLEMRFSPQSGESYTRLMVPQDLTQCLEVGEDNVILVSGDAGIGKTTLAFLIAHWLMKGEPDGIVRLPVFINTPLANNESVLVRVCRWLARNLPLEETQPDEEFVEALLRAKKLVPIIDQLSEFSSDAREQIMSSLPAGLTIVTSRIRLQFRGRALTRIQPQPIALDRLQTFFVDYIKGRSQGDLLRDDELLPAQNQLRRIARDQPITVLLARLFIEDVMVNNKKLMSDSVAELMLRYIRALDTPADPTIRNRAGMTINEALVERALRVVALASYQQGPDGHPLFIPLALSYEKACSALMASTPGGLGIPKKQAEALLGYLIDMGLLIQPKSTTGVLNLPLNCLADYLASLHLLETRFQSGDLSSWEDFLESLELYAKEELKRMSGFLMAFCYSGKGYQMPDTIKDAIMRLVSSLEGSHTGGSQLSAEAKRDDNYGNCRCYILYSGIDGSRYALSLIEELEKIGMTVDCYHDYNEKPSSVIITRLREIYNQVDVVMVVGTRQALSSERILFECKWFAMNSCPIISIAVGDVADMAPLHFTSWVNDSWVNSPSQELLKSIIGNLPNSAPRIKDETFDQITTSWGVEKLPLNECKLILVGRGEVGKTSIVRRLCDNEFSPDESKTQGIKISTWTLLAESEEFRINIWDFGGQEIMHTTHQLFLSERSLYLLVLNGREGAEETDIEYWMKHIQVFGGDSPVIVVQNKISQHPFDLDYKGLRSRFPQIRGFHKTDCREPFGIPELSENIRSIITTGMPDVRMELPVSWIVVKDKLQSMNQEYLSLQDFTNLCFNEGITGETDRNALGFILHCLGIALNYRDDLRLCETSVLKPEWLTQGIYLILNSERLSEQKGVLNIRSLEEILPQKKYPKTKHLFLLEIMRKFSLCFRVPSEDDHYLIPDLLCKEEPLGLDPFDPENCLNFEYHFDLLPEGILPRFIARTHTLSEGEYRWKTGVILRYGESRSLVKAEIMDRRIIIRVKEGDANSRRELLNIIRYDLNRIHAEFKDRLDAKEMVPLPAFPNHSIDYKKLCVFERVHKNEFDEVIGNTVVRVDVRKLLNGVDFQGRRADFSNSPNNTKSVFFSYSHKDQQLRDELENHLKLLQRQRIISTWHDRRILAGEEWDQEIDIRLKEADIILLLVSSDFIASDYCWDKEVELALKRHNSREATVIPILLRTCDWKQAPFGKLQGLPTNMIAITMWEDRDSAWTNIALGIRDIAEQ